MWECENKKTKREILYYINNYVKTLCTSKYVIEIKKNMSHRARMYRNYYSGICVTCIVEYFYYT